VQEIVVLERTGKLPLQIDMYIDCFSIFESLSQEQIRTPSEQTLILLLLSLKEALCSGQLRSLIWVNTLDQLADGFTKGAITRKDIVDAFCKGIWMLKHECKVFRETRRLKSDE
jgi:hypothetical protein